MRLSWPGAGVRHRCAAPTCGTGRRRAAPGASPSRQTASTADNPAGPDRCYYYCLNLLAAGLAAPAGFRVTHKKGRTPEKTWSADKYPVFCRRETGKVLFKVLHTDEAGR